MNIKKRLSEFANRILQMIWVIYCRLDPNCYTEEEYNRMLRYWLEASDCHNEDSYHEILMGRSKPDKIPTGD